jgi:hypothetical protein
MHRLFYGAVAAVAIATTRRFHTSLTTWYLKVVPTLKPTATARAATGTERSNKTDWCELLFFKID